MAADTPLHVLKTISKLLTETSMIGDVSERTSKLNDYVGELEAEMKRMDGYKHELPLCMGLLNDACERLKEEIRQCRRREVQPVLIEFLPLKGNLDEDREAKLSNDCSDEKNWMSSLKLWNTSPGCHESDIKTQDPKLDLQSRDKEEVQLCNLRSRSGGAFVPFSGQYTPLMKGKEKVVSVYDPTSCVLALAAATKETKASQNGDFRMQSSSLEDRKVRLYNLN